MKPFYLRNFLTTDVATDECNRLWETLDWEKRENAPRREYWMNDFDVPYTYGSGEYARTYDAKPWDTKIREYMSLINSAQNIALNCCFVNGYAHQRQHLGWHADDSAEMSPEVPVAVVSVGAEREIWCRSYADPENIMKQMLHNGSLFIMPLGFQQLYQHRIPKAQREVGPRVSLTYRGLIPVS